MTGADSYSESLADFLRRLWLARIFIIFGAILGATVGLFLILTLQPHYEARMIVAPALVQDTGESLMRFETGGDAVRRSIGLDNSLPADFVKFEQVLRENTVAGILSHYDGVLDKIAHDHMFTFTPDEQMNGGLLSDYLLRHIKIQPIGTTGSRMISYAHPDPQFAVKILKHLHTIADETIRQKTAGETQERIAWLQKELSQSANPDHRDALTSLLLAQERRRMLVAMDQPFAAEIVEPPAASAKPDWPSKPLVLLAAIFIGMLAGFTLSSLRRPA